MRKNKIILALDTTASPLTAVIKKDGKIYRASKKGIKQEELLFPVIKNLLKKADCEFKEIKKVFFIRGPGRFTGIRIGMTLASMMRSLNGAEAVSATMFEVMHDTAAQSKEFAAWKEENKNGVHAVVLHAFREEYFLQYFDGSEPVWLSKETLLENLAAYSSPLFITGFGDNGASLKKLLGNSYILGTDKLCKVNPAVLCDMAEKKTFEKNTLEPLYLKPARFETGK